MSSLALFQIYYSMFHCSSYLLIFLILLCLSVMLPRQKTFNHGLSFYQSSQVLIPIIRYEFFFFILLAPKGLVVVWISKPWYLWLCLPYILFVELLKLTAHWTVLAIVGLVYWVSYLTRAEFILSCGRLRKFIVFWYHYSVGTWFLIVASVISYYHLRIIVFIRWSHACVIAGSS
jgi:hypothetical protein